MIHLGRDLSRTPAPTKLERLFKTDDSRGHLSGSYLFRYEENTAPEANSGCPLSNVPRWPERKMRAYYRASLEQSLMVIAD